MKNRSEHDGAGTPFADRVNPGNDVSHAIALPEADDFDLDRMLEKRAARLAARADDRAEDKAADISLLVFDCAEGEYGVDMAHVDEVMRAGRVTPVPGSVTTLLGVVNLRGKICPVLNLRHLLRISGTEERMTGDIVFLKNGERPVGMVVDGFVGIQSVDCRELDTIEAEEDTESAAFVGGVTATNVVVLKHRSILEALVSGAAGASGSGRGSTNVNGGEGS